MAFSSENYEALLITIRSVAFLFFSLIIIIVNSYKLRKNRKKNKKGINVLYYKVKNNIRLLINISFLLFFILNLLKIMRYGFQIPLDITIVSEDIATLSITTVLMGFVYVTGSIIIIYLNSWDNFLLFPLFLYIGAVFIQITIGFNVFQVAFQIFSGFFIFAGFLEAGIRYKTPLAATLSIGVFGVTLAFFYPSPIKQYIEFVALLIAFIYSMFFIREITRIEEKININQKESSSHKSEDEDNDFIIIL